MARKSEAGIEYFPMNTNIIHNPKIKLVVAEFGPKAWAVLLPLFCKIYREKGYWVDWHDEDSKLLFAQDDCKIELSIIKEVVNGCIRRSLFDKGVFDMFGVLTSDRIQENYLQATKRRKSTDLIKEFLLLKIDYVNNLNENVNIINLNVSILTKKVNIGTQSKVKEEEKKSKVEVVAPQPQSQLSFETREHAFYELLTGYVDTYGKDMLRKFYDYWREPNKARTKMRWEQEKTWDLTLRLQRWAANNFEKQGQSAAGAHPSASQVVAAVKAIENGKQ